MAGHTVVAISFHTSFFFFASFLLHFYFHKSVYYDKMEIAPNVEIHLVALVTASTIEKHIRQTDRFDYRNAIVSTTYHRAYWWFMAYVLFENQWISCEFLRIDHMIHKRSAKAKPTHHHKCFNAVVLEIGIIHTRTMLLAQPPASAKSPKEDISWFKHIGWMW